MVTISAIALLAVLFMAAFEYFNIFPLEKYGKYLSKRVIWSVDTSAPVVALTFDDGPHREFTPTLLDSLNQLNVRATFFVIGRYVDRYPDIVRRIAAEGHEIGNHSYSHNFLTLHTAAQIGREIDSATAAISRAGGAKPALFRPPQGLFTPTLLDIVESRGLKTVIGDVYPRDPYNPGTKAIVERVLKRVEPGSIIILHDGSHWRWMGRSQTIAAVPIIIRELRNKGYRFLTVSELLALGGGELVGARHAVPLRSAVGRYADGRISNL